MNRADVERWLDAYMEAWRANEPEGIGALFSDDARYRYYPYEDGITGRDRIVEAWLADPDDPEGWEASFEPVAVDGDVAVVTGTTAYSKPQRAVYDNCFVMRFGTDGRCAEFTEYYVERPTQ